PDFCYVFTQVGLETLQWAHDAGVATILESPNGHIRNFRGVCEKELQTWGSGAYRRHPSSAMVKRIFSTCSASTRRPRTRRSARGSSPAIASNPRSRSSRVWIRPPALEDWRHGG